ncbi:MAG: sigma-54 interaction domain-containing protein [Deferrisomatales bacterium]
MRRKQDKPQLETSEALRSRAEKRVRDEAWGGGAPRSPADTQKLVHELEVHQVEVEMQNVELRRAIDELEVSRNKYLELYDFAPIAYFTLDLQGVLLDVNFAAERMFGTNRRLLAGKPFVDLVASSESVERFTVILEVVLQGTCEDGCELEVKAGDGSVRTGRLQIVKAGGSKSGSAKSCILGSFVDNTIRNQLQFKLKNEHDVLELLVEHRTKELVAANNSLTNSIQEITESRESLKKAYAEITRLTARLQAENIYLQKEVAHEYNLDQIIGQSEALSHVFFQIEQVAPQDTTVLLLGETGTGKGVIARALHQRSARKERPMITVNCSALPENLIESELFGREKGAFTGATDRQMGRFELADKGTIFLDEIGEMPLGLQAKLLRVLQEGEFERLGSPRTIKTDVRVIAASNRNLEAEIRAGRFRQDLFYRLNVFPITIPPLRQRTDDILPLVQHFVAKFNRKLGRKIETISPETLRIFRDYPWPGNVRELESVIERAAITSWGDTLEVLDQLAPLCKARPGIEAPEVQLLADVEHSHIMHALRQTGWRIEGSKGAAVLLGINPSTLRARMRKHGISSRLRRDAEAAPQG